MTVKSGSNFDISVIMPSLNEEKNIAAALENTLAALEKFKIRGEVIAIDDGSSDRTADLVKAAAKDNPAISLLSHSRPQGIGASFWDGVANARGNAIVLIPGDNECIPEEIFRYYGLLKDVDMIIPFVLNKEVRPPLRLLLSFIYKLIINFTFFVNFNYTNGTIIYRKSVLEDAGSRNMGFFFQTDILIRAVKKGYLFAEVPYRLGKRKAGDSKAFSLRSLLNVIKGYLRLTFDYYFKKHLHDKKGFAPDSATAIRRSANNH
ncbi:MAG: glycosyltransferase family 2 protein [Candidatus Omnitrophota bacterium]